MFESNSNENYSENSKKLTKLLLNFKESILFTADCYWPKSKVYLVLGYDGNTWKLIKLTQIYKSRTKTKNNIRRVRKVKLPINDSCVVDLISYLKANTFFSLNNDTININYVQNSDGSQTVYSPSDGCNEIFQIKTKSSFKIINCYLPEKMQNLIPIKEREVFINCKKKFFDFIECR